MSQQFKSGRLSKSEVEQLKQYVEQGLSYEQISVKLNRPVQRIKEVVENHLLMNLSDDAKSVRQAELDIKGSPEWREIVQQFSEEEQETFLHHWREMVSQFKNDVTHTEKLQIIDAIRTDIMLNRVLKKIYRANVVILESQNNYQTELMKEDGMRDVDKMIDYQKQIADITAAIGTYNKESETLSGRKQTLLKDMKATRDQRVQRIEQSKETLASWVASLVASPDLRRDLGVQMEKNRIAKEVELIRLSEYFKYIDGNLEQPILSSETILDDNV